MSEETDIRTEQEKRDDVDAACRLYELQVKFGLPDGSPEEIAATIGMILDLQKETLDDLWAKVYPPERA